MKLRVFSAALTVLGCAAMIACSSTSSVIPAHGGGTLHPLGGEPPAIGGGDGGNGSPAPQPTPDAAAEDACNTGGGTFYDDVGGAGVTCAGQDGGPGAVTSYNANCDYTIEITKGNGSISRGGTLLGSFQKGIEVFGDCSYNMYS